MGRTAREQHLGRILIAGQHCRIVRNALVNQHYEWRGPVGNGLAQWSNRLSRDGLQSVTQTRIFRCNFQRQVAVDADKLAQCCPAVVFDRRKRSSYFVVAVAVCMTVHFAVHHIACLRRQQSHACKHCGGHLHRHQVQATARQAGFEGLQALSNANCANAVLKRTLTMHRCRNRAYLTPKAPVDNVHRKSGMSPHMARNRILSHGRGGIVGLASVAKKRIG